MPLSLDPSDTLPAWLASDEDKPEATRPTFYLRFITARQRSEVQRLASQAEKATQENNRAEVVRLLNSAIAIGVVGWSNMGRDFKPSDFDEFLTDDELGELVLLVLQKPRMAEEDRRFFALQQRLNGGSSASPAAAGDVPTSSQPASPET